jgi:hypothetical protein
MLKKLNNWILKWPGLFGIPFYLFFAQAAVTATNNDPDADFLDISGEFYGSVVNAATENFLPGTWILLQEIFRLSADYAFPLMGTVLTEAFKLAADALETPVPALTPAPALSL